VKVKTNELKGAALDWAVAKAIGKRVGIWPAAHPSVVTIEPSRPQIYDPEKDYEHSSAREFFWSPSTDWAACGPLIEQFGVQFQRVAGEYPAYSWLAGTDSGTAHAHADTHLIAACRAIVAEKLGAEVGIPDELA
jgi:hypothetical protein